METPIIAANWKLHKSPALTRRYLSEFLNSASEAEQKAASFFPPAICLEAAADCLEGTPVSFGAQNCWKESEGAFTGENSVKTVADLGADWVLLGHSERRQIFGEDEETLAQKIKLVAEAKLASMYCIGEKLDEREAGQEVEVWKRQLTGALSNFNTQAELAVAYEPVWAIGTGKVAEVDQVAQAHKEIRRLLSDLHGAEWASRVPLLYGGSVKPANVSDLAALEEVDGFLVGGASLEVDSFRQIIAKTLEAKTL